MRIHYNRRAKNGNVWTIRLKRLCLHVKRFQIHRQFIDSEYKPKNENPKACIVVRADLYYNNKEHTASIWWRMTLQLPTQSQFKRLEEQHRHKTLSKTKKGKRTFIIVITPRVIEILAMLQRNGSKTTNDLARLFDSSVPRMNNHLYHLRKHKLIDFIIIKKTNDYRRTYEYNISQRGLTLYNLFKDCGKE